MDSRVHPLCELHWLPRWLVKGPAKKWVSACFRDELYSEVMKTAAFEYFWTMLERPSILEIVQIMPFKFDCFSIHPLQSEDRLGNPEIDFPIGIAFGDRDNFGSEGAD